MNVIRFTIKIKMGIFNVSIINAVISYCIFRRLQFIDRVFFFRYCFFPFVIFSLHTNFGNIVMYFEFDLLLLTTFSIL